MSRRSRRPADDPSLPIVSLVGRPNVGKSSLFNRLVGGQPALVEDMPGVTRDRRYGACEWVGARFRLTDTGGLDPGASGILGAMRSQTLRAVDEAAVLILVLDVKEGITPVDQEVAQLLRRTGKPVLVAANKVDSATREPNMAEVFRLGFDQVFGVSAAHGRGVGDLLDATVAALGSLVSPSPVEQGEGTSAAEPESAPIRLAFVGKPNVGKSSLVNRLLGQERVLVHDQPGTTRDPIDTPFSWQGREFVLVDTAGLRRRRAVDTLTEAVSAKMARDQLARADVVALVIDAQNGATAEDAKLASFIEESGRAALIVVNKGDLIRRAEIDKRVAAVREELGFMAWAPVVVTSAVTGRGTGEIPRASAEVFAQWCRRVPTSELNKHFEEFVTRRPPPAGPGGSYVRLYYITQAQTSPPSFFVSANYPKAVGLPYRRYLTNQLREIYGFEGSPLRLVLRAHKGKKPVRKAR
ncbi:MAG: ribosome biogenesis GTPase Der [Polyangia bacterium]